MRRISELRISRDYPPVDDDQIRTLEEQIGFTLPSTYVEFVRQTNGGYPEVDTFSNNTGEWSVNNFLFLDTDGVSTESIIWTHQHLLPVDKCQQSSPGDTMRFLPFARTGGGDPFCLDLTGAQDPVNDAPVVILLHDAEPVGPYRLADSFQEFIDGLHENPDYT